MADPILLNHPLATLEDHTLMARVAAQEPEALAELFRRYGGRVLAYVRAMTHARFPAEDVVQEIFLALWQKAGLYAPQGPDAAGWIFTVTRHKVFDIQRSLGRVKESEGVDLDLLAPGEPPADPTLAPSISKAMAMLPDDQRIPLRMAYFGDLTYEEAAKRLGVPLGTFKSRVRSGLATLKGLLSAGRKA